MEKSTYFSNTFVNETSDDIDILFIEFSEDFISIWTQIDQTFGRVRFINSFLVENDLRCHRLLDAKFIFHFVTW